MTLRNQMTAIVCLLLLLLAACGADDSTPTNKGPEEDALGGKDDSLVDPTEHGELVFDEPAAAEIFDGALFHAWTFELSDTATVQITTQINDDLDTVLYLFHRTSPDENWGEHIAKNDDFDSQNIWSEITHEGAAGQYRIIVKPHDLKMRGTFAVAAQCEGPGCTAGGGTCDPSDTTFDLPTSSDFAVGCAGKIRDVLLAPVTSDNLRDSFIDKRCQLSPIGRKAAEHYHAFTNENGTFDADFPMSVLVEAHGDAGNLVLVDIGGENSVIFLYDGNDELLLRFDDGQVKTPEFFCQDGDATAEEPDTDCLYQTLFQLPHETRMAEEGTTTPATVTQDAPRARAAVESYKTDFSIADDETINYSMETFRTSLGAEGAIVDLSSGANDVTYDVITDAFGDPIVPFRTQDGETSFQCDFHFF